MRPAGGRGGYPTLWKIRKQLACGKRRSRSLRLVAALLICVSLIGCEGSDQDSAPAFELLEGATMGTYYRVSCRCPSAAASAPENVTESSLAAQITRELELVNEQMSTYLPDSELSRFNDGPVAEWQTVSPALLEVVVAAQQISRLSDGAFDITVGPLVNLWGFGPGGRIEAVPDPAELAAARSRVGSGYLEQDPMRPALRKTRPVYLDLSAIAKGHGVDRIAAVLDLQGCSDYLVDIGGEVIARGLNPRGQSWRIGIEVPDPDRMGGVQRILRLPDVAVATSGDYRNFLDLDGQRISHTVDPRSGRPVTHGLASVSVVHSSAMWADGLATALNVLGPEAGYQLALQQDWAAFFLTRRAAGFEERYTPAMQQYLETP